MINKIDSKKITLIIFLIVIFLGVLLFYSFKLRTSNNSDSTGDEADGLPVLTKADFYLKASNLKQTYTYVYEIEGMIFSAKYNENGTYSVDGSFEIKNQENSILDVLSQEKSINNWDIVIAIPYTGDCYELDIKDTFEEDSVLVGLDVSKSEFDCSESINNGFVEVFEAVQGSKEANILPYVNNTEVTLPSLLIDFEPLSIDETEVSVKGDYDDCYNAILSNKVLSSINKTALVLELNGEMDCDNKNYVPFDFKSNVTSDSDLYLLISF
ncbi:hypothetical protein KC669_04705 [Candidatus Dojkabacteria bacterium]|uniref:Uncharacterized protein n=1 Tax=Candidatus Dojkabacteria bacterium TaxID=2099670 RepID=A0A955LBP0_9BACT|nr:hypothetical protein [Candidatus Dojkabacteria bacterium]